MFLTLGFEVGDGAANLRSNSWAKVVHAGGLDESSFLSQTISIASFRSLRSRIPRGIPCKAFQTFGEVVFYTPRHSLDAGQVLRHSTYSPLYNGFSPFDGGVAGVPFT